MEADAPRVQVSVSRAQGPRLYHKKSKNGCQRCRRRRVKCDETHPICSSCGRHGVSCVYEDNFRHGLLKRNTSLSSQSRANTPSLVFPVKTNPSPQEKSSTSNVGDPSSVLIDFHEPPESAGRRLTELRLLHQFVTETCDTFSGAQNPFVRNIWAKSVPALAISHPALLNALLSVSALHLWRQSPTERQLQDAYQTYYVLALQSHRSSVQNFENARDADATWFTSILIFIHAFAVLRDRPISDPYEPPVIWLRITHGVRKVFEWTVTAVENDETTGAHAMIKSIPALVATAASKQTSTPTEFLSLLLPVKTGDPTNDAEDAAELLDDEIRKAYTGAAAYLGLIQQSINRNDHVQDICRWLIAFPVIVSSKMIALIEAKRPRALAILAHFFALVGSCGGAMERVWWVGPIARREVEGIVRSLPSGWEEILRFPVGVVGEGTEMGR